MDLTRALQSTLFQNPGVVVWAFRTKHGRMEILGYDIGLPRIHHFHFIMCLVSLVFTLDELREVLSEAVENVGALSGLYGSPEKHQTRAQTLSNGLLPWIVRYHSSPSKLAQDTRDTATLTKHNITLARLGKPLYLQPRSTIKVNRFFLLSLVLSEA